MTWVKLDDGFADHPKIAGLSDAAFRAFVEGLCYCSRHLTDGRIPIAIQRRITRTPPARELVENGLWEQHTGFVMVHDYLEFQPDSATIRAKRAADSARKKRGIRTESSGPVPVPIPIKKNQGL